LTIVGLNSCKLNICNYIKYLHKINIDSFQKFNIVKLFRVSLHY
jgi:hypothetical protein